MRDAGTHAEEPLEKKAPPAKRRPGMMQDPVVRRMAFAAAALVVLFLATIVGVLVSGVTTPSGPRTLAERDAAVSGAAVLQGSTDVSVWGDYIAALIASGQTGRARDVIAQGRESVDDSMTAEFSLAEARLHVAQKDYDAAIEVAETGKKQIQDEHDAAVAGGGEKAQRARIEGLHENYYLLCILEADAYVELGEWASAIEQYDIYIARNAGAADILVDRGNAKIEIKDIEGAEADFRKALSFIPDDAGALAGLEKIGAANND